MVLDFPEKRRGRNLFLENHNRKRVTKSVTLFESSVTLLKSVSLYLNQNYKTPHGSVPSLAVPIPWSLCSTFIIIMTSPVLFRHLNARQDIHSRNHADSRTSTHKKTPVRGLPGGRTRAALSAAHPRWRKCAVSGRGVRARI